jgi:hypothetical protein
MERIFNKMIHYLGDSIPLNVESNKDLFLTFHKNFNEIDYTILIINTNTNKPVYSNTYYHPDFDVLFNIFNQSTIKMTTMDMILKYNHVYETFDLVE